MYGISGHSFQLILPALAGFTKIERVALYGSRAMGNFKKGSDIDLALFGKDITTDTVLKLRTQLEQELPIPYFFI